jgi:hypothetical protein
LPAAEASMAASKRQTSQAKFAEVFDQVSHAFPESTAESQSLMKVVICVCEHAFSVCMTGAYGGTSDVGTLDGAGHEVDPSPPPPSFVPLDEPLDELAVPLDDPLDELAVPLDEPELPPLDEPESVPPEDDDGLPPPELLLQAPPANGMSATLAMDAQRRRGLYMGVAVPRGPT